MVGPHLEVDAAPRGVELHAVPKVLDATERARARCGTACDAAARPLKLPDDPKKNNTNPRMCEQLLDETNRLNAEADRAGKRGAPESADNAKRRIAMTKQYEARCAGISRSVTK